MALQSSGAISVSDLATEFGGTAPHSLSEYYRGGGLVPDSPANAGIPSSGQIQLDDFYGGSSVSGPTPGYLWAWGMNTEFGKVTTNYYMVGNGSTVSVSSPVQVSGGGSDWVELNKFGYPYASNNGAIKGSAGNFYIWGRNLVASTGTGFNAPSLSAPTFQGPNGTGVKQFAIHGGGGAYVRNDGRMWLWGTNMYGGAAQGNTPGNNAPDNYTPTPSQVYNGGTDWDQVTFQQVKKTDGRVYAWAGQSSFQRVTSRWPGGSDQSSTSAWGYPQQIDWGISDCEQVLGIQAASSAMIRSDGRLWGIGSNTVGGLGTNSTSGTQVSSPVQTVSGGTDWASLLIRGAPTNGCGGIKTDGRLWLWGINVLGELGTNDTVPRSSPVQTVAGGTNWSQAGASNANAVGLKTDGRLWCWGYDLYGTSGLNSSLPVTGYRGSPAETISGGTSWVAVGIARHCSMGIKT